jgi:hypothetical protein
MFHAAIDDEMAFGNFAMARGLGRGFMKTAPLFSLASPLL